MADGHKVYSNLMRSARQRTHLQQRHLRKSLQDTKLCHGWFARGEDSHTLSPGGITPDGAFNPAFVFCYTSSHQGYVDLFDSPALELFN
jgi:hypothetical protein